MNECKREYLLGKLEKIERRHEDVSRRLENLAKTERVNPLDVVGPQGPQKPLRPADTPLGTIY